MDQHEVVKKEILETAKEVFAKYGYQKTTMNDIANESYKAKSTLYHYFNSKSEIFTLIVKQEMDKIRMNCISSANKSDDLVEKIRLFIFAFFEKDTSEFTEKYGYEVLYDFFHFMPLIKDILKEHQEFSINFLSDLISEGVERGIFFTDDIQRTAKALMMSIIPFSHEFPDIVDKDISTAEYLFDLIIKGLTTK